MKSFFNIVLDRNENGLVQILPIFLMLLICAIGESQEVKHQFGQSTFCIVDSSTTQIFLSSHFEDEGLLFVLNEGGKICSSGKNTHPDDEIYMVEQLTEMRNDNIISNKIFDRVKCSLVNLRKVKEYMARDPAYIEEAKILELIENKDCN